MRIEDRTKNRSNHRKHVTKRSINSTLLYKFDLIALMQVFGYIADKII